MENKTYRAQRGDLMLFMDTRPLYVSEEGSLLSCFWALARVTGVTADGDVIAYRTLGAHFVSRELPAQCTVLPAGKVDMRAIERDMAVRVTKDAAANEFAAPDYAYEYVIPFMREPAHDGV